MNILPEGEQLRRAIRWISEKRSEDPDMDLSKIIAEACLKFDLPPKDAEFLIHFLAQNKPL